MDERTKELIAIGASAAVNCHPCMRHHLGLCDELGIPRAEVDAAAEVGLMVGRGAARKTREFVAELLAAEEPPVEASAAAGCC
jgi:AhpD family alkylhydroperoxidase